MKIVSKILFARILMALFVFLGVASNVLADLPPGQPITLPEVDSLITQVAQFLIVISVLIAVIMIVWSGITYMTAGSNATKVTEAQARLKNAVIGTAVVLGVGVIIQTIAGIVTRDFFCRVKLLGICIIN